MERLRELDHPHICKTLDAFEDGFWDTTRLVQNPEPLLFGWIFGIPLASSIFHRDFPYYKHHLWDFPWDFPDFFGFSIWDFP